MLAIIFAGNFFASNVQAEIKNYSGRGAALFDFGDEDAKTTETAKNIAKLRAIKQAFEKAGFFILSYAEETLNGKTTDEYISAIVRDMATIENEKIDKYFFNSEEYNRPGYIYEANLIAKIDTDKIAKYFQLDSGEKQKLIERDQVAKKNFEEIDSEFENLRKTADTKTQAQIKSELEKIDNKISSQNKPVEQKNIPMIFSQPVEIGEIYTDPSLNGIIIRNATNIYGNISEKFGKENVYSTVKAVFGKENYILHLHFQPYSAVYGGEDVLNTVNVALVDGNCIISKVENNKNIPLFLIFDMGGGGITYALIGKMTKGKWVKYFDTFDNSKDYSIGKVFINEIFCREDKIIMKYRERQSNKTGEFRFKWDNAAQWFGIEQIKY